LTPYIFLTFNVHLPLGSFFVWYVRFCKGRNTFEAVSVSAVFGHEMRMVVKFEVLTAVHIKMTVFWVVAP
jgi:hypothetical protein